ncbi:hypothetical protein AAAC51_43435 [Priestia megaterium]
MQSKVEDAAHKTKEVAGKAKDKVSDVIGDVWSYASDPGKLMNKVFGALNLKMPDVGGFMGQLAKSGVSKIKDGAVGFVKSKMDEFMSFMGGGEDSSVVGPGSGYGGMHKYVEYWYNQVKSRFGKTHFMGGYNNRNVRGEKVSPCMHMAEHLMWVVHTKQCLQLLIGYAHTLRTYNMLSTTEELLQG